MKKILFSLLILIISENCQAQNASSISIGHKDTIYSNILGETRELWIRLPRGAENSLYNTQYPVLYLLDGDVQFYGVTAIITDLSDNGNSKLPEMIVVGITNTNRMRDMSPTNVAFDPSSGGADNFLDFIEKELMPYVEKKYPVVNNKTFVGHSLGGLAVINAFCKRPQMFNNYIAIDPHLTWDEQYILKRTDSLLNIGNFENKSLYVGIANTMPIGMDYSTVMEDTTRESLTIRSILEFSNKLDSIKPKGLSFKWQYYNDDTHTSVPLITQYDALRYFYSWFECEWYNDVFYYSYKYSGSELVEIVNKHYAKVSTKMACQFYPNEELINSIAYYFSRNNEPEKGYAFFNLNIQNYPKSFNAHDSMGDYYVMQQDWPNAIKYFEIALSLGAGELTKDKLTDLKSKK